MTDCLIKGILYITLLIDPSSTIATTVLSNVNSKGILYSQGGAPLIMAYTGSTKS